MSVISYDEYINSDERDSEPIYIEPAVVDIFPETIFYDRFFRAFVLEKARRIVPVENFLAAFGDPLLANP